MNRSSSLSTLEDFGFGKGVSNGDIGEQAINIFKRSDKTVRSPGDIGGQAKNIPERSDETVRSTEIRQEENAQKRSRLDLSPEHEEDPIKESGWMERKFDELLKEIRANRAMNDSGMKNIKAMLEVEKEERKREREQFMQEITKLREQVKSCEQKIDELENRSRRQNLIFRGVEEKVEENWDMTEKLVKDVVLKAYGVELHGIARAHRIGKKGGKWPRPIVVKFEREKEKEVLLRERGKLKGTRVYVDEDFSMLVREKRKKLFEVMKEERAKGKKAYVSFDKLVLEGKTYEWNEESRSLVRKVAQGGMREQVENL